MNLQAEVEWPNERNDQAERTRVLLWDGRLDNRSDLILLLKDYLRGDSSNSSKSASARARCLGLRERDTLALMLSSWRVFPPTSVIPHRDRS